jgi:hypothetical protein
MNRALTFSYEDHTIDALGVVQMKSFHALLSFIESSSLNKLITSDGNLTP